MRYWEIEENGIYVRFGITETEEDGPEPGVLKLFHFSALPPAPAEDFAPRMLREGFPFVGLNLSGYDRPFERHGNQYIVTAPGYLLKYVSHEDTRNDKGRLLTILTEDKPSGIRVNTVWQFYDGLPVIRMKNIVENVGDSTQTVEYISNFHYEGIEKEGKKAQNDKMRIYVPHNGWQRELEWRAYSLHDLALEQNQPSADMRTSKLLSVSNTGNWSAKEYLPMGYLENEETKSGLFWQIEHNGSWHWEVGYQHGHMYLALGGPNEIYSHWFRDLKPGESFETVPAAVGVTAAGFDDAMGTLTQYRRAIRRPNEDDERLPVIFNDYMNCLFADPTTEKEFPLIDAAAEAGCEYYVVDAGWYADGDWWDSVGEWKESRKRFPNGLSEVMDYIRSKGMTPGLWLEPEVMGIRCEKAGEVPDDWFFVRHGKRVFDRSRYQLDFRNPEVRAYVDSVIDRLVQEYHVGYIKMDYNIEPGIGTELHADSAGDGMLGHERAVLDWLDGVFARYPDLVIENCSSGGLRMDYAMLSKLSIQSTSDNEDYLNYATISANAPSAVAPEQSAVWSYPLNHAMPEGLTEEEKAAWFDGQREETIYNMVNTMLMRIHQSGHLVELEDVRKQLVIEGIETYKKIRSDIRISVPFWPIGLAKQTDEWVATGLKNESGAYLALWKRPVTEDPSMSVLPASVKAGKAVLPDSILVPLPEETKDVTCIYPAGNDVTYLFDPDDHILRLETDKPVMARLFRLEF